MICRPSEPCRPLGRDDQMARRKGRSAKQRSDQHTRLTHPAPVRDSLLPAKRMADVAIGGRVEAPRRHEIADLAFPIPELPPALLRASRCLGLITLIVHVAAQAEVGAIEVVQPVTAYFVRGHERREEVENGITRSLRPADGAPLLQLCAPLIRAERL